MDREELKSALEQAAKDGKISCEEAWDLADKADVERIEVGKLADEAGVKIRACQLGCF